MRLSLPLRALAGFGVAFVLSEGMFVVIGTAWYWYLFPVAFFVVLLVVANAGAKSDADAKNRINP